MAHGHDPQPGDTTEHEPHHSHTKLYVGIFFLLLVVTALEVFLPSSIARDMGIELSKVPEVLILLTLMTFKGACVMMFYMHLKGDRRMFGSLFVFPLIVVFGMIFSFLLLFQPKLW